MARKKATKAAPTKSDHVRKQLARTPAASIRQIQDKLAAKGVDVSVALIGKLKYGKSKSKASSNGKPGARAQHGEKAGETRAAFERLGMKVRNRDIVADLAERGITVSPAQVSTVRKALGKKRSRRAAAAASVQDVSYAHLMAARALVQEVGGIVVAREALNMFAKLLPAEAN